MKFYIVILYKARKLLIAKNQPARWVEVTFSQPAGKCMKKRFSVEQLSFVLLN